MITIAKMYTVKLMPEFSDWLNAIADGLTRRRLEKVQRGNLGDVKSVGEGVWEMREFFGPGWRMYYVIHGNTVVVMLGGGDKSTQRADIATATALAQSIDKGA